ncbi:MAG: hypothetical protein CMM28_12505 [Rhodospirillaceae bacterium]|mgnify:CR=1 FL=1|nr:hypothetical protein [Rhodospirillaceae bacterium]
MPTTIPFDLTQEGALDLHWRAHFRWPVPSSALYERHIHLANNYLRFAASLKSDARDIVLLGRVASLGALVDAAFAVQAEGKDSYLAGPGELDVLRGIRTAETFTDRNAGHHGKHGTVRHRTLRQIARTASWSTGMTLLPNLLTPKGIALSHNSLLRDYISHNGVSVGYRHGDAYLDKLLATNEPAALDFDMNEVVDGFLKYVVSFPDLAPEFVQRLHTLIRPLLKSSLTLASGTLGTLRSCPSLPNTIWTGTGARGPGRAIGLEVLRRGGEAWRFDHGGTAALSSAHAAFAANELSVSSHVVMPTQTVTTSDMMLQAKKVTANIRKTKTLGHNGDPSLNIGKAAFRKVPKSKNRRRVLYVSVAFYGFYQTSTPILPGIVYLDWQVRLIEALKSLPIELTCKPHPEGLLRGKVPGVEKLAPINPAPFEQAIKEADLLITDHPASTTFSIGLCTDRPMVLVDLGLFRFNNTVSAKLAERCRILKATYDTNNIPQVDQSHLAEAVCGGSETADPTFFRSIFLDTPS